MAQVKFFNTAKYKGVFYPAHTPFEVDDKDVDALVQKGAIVTVAPEEVKAPQKAVDEMKIGELREYAADNNIDISGLEKKADILAAVKAAGCSEE